MTGAPRRQTALPAQRHKGSPAAQTAHNDRGGSEFPGTPLSTGPPRPRERPAPREARRRAPRDPAPRAPSPFTASPRCSGISPSPCGLCAFTAMNLRPGTAL